MFAGVSILFRSNFIVLFFLLLHLPAVSQNREMDSLSALVKTAKEDTNKVKLLYQLSEICDEADILKYAEPAYMLARQLAFKKGIGDAANNMGYAFRNKGDIPRSIQYFKEALDIRKEINDSTGIAYSLNNLALVYNHQGNIGLALSYYQQSLVMQQELHDTLGIATAYNNLGLMHFNQNDYAKALDFYEKSYEQVKLLGKKSRQAYCLNNMGTVFKKMGQDQKALDVYKQAAVLQEEVHDVDGLAYTYDHMGLLYQTKKTLDSSLKYHDKSRVLWEGIANKLGMSYAYNNLADVYMLMNDYGKAGIYAEKGFALSNELGFPENISGASLALSKIYFEKGRYKEAYQMHLLFKRMSDSISSQETRRSTLKNQMEFEFGMKEQAQKSEQDKKDALANEELARQKVVRNSFIGGFLLMLLMGTVVLRGYRQKQKANILLEEKNELIAQQKELVEEKNKDITDSINYAKKIQEALLPAKEIKYRLFPDAFVLFQPRDIVSGDFYWFTEKDGKRIIAAVDCTGHGVPGAFMSMIGNAFLNEIVNERGITSPAEILGELRHLVIKALKQTGAPGEQKDGMDISLLCLDRDGITAQWAGANNPVWILRGTECIEIKADKRPIGYFRGEGLPFTNQVLSLQKNDSVYLFTDGFADQFGGEKGKKFKYKHFQELLAAIQDKKMPEQEAILQKRFIEWKGDLEQVDDVLIIGIRI
jgi:serine phosphatase RsbU (regulator of sigma subunit)